MVGAFYLWHFKTGICFQLGNIWHAAPNGTEQERARDTERHRERAREREQDYHECAAEYPTNCHRVPTGAVNTNDSMEPCGIHIQPPGRGDHISEVAGPFASFLERTLHSLGSRSAVRLLSPLTGSKVSTKPSLVCIMGHIQVVRPRKPPDGRRGAIAANERPSADELFTTHCYCSM